MVHIAHVHTNSTHTHTHIKIDKIINIANLWSGIIFLLVGVSISYLLCPHRRYTAVRAAQHCWLCFWLNHWDHSPDSFALRFIAGSLKSRDTHSIINTIFFFVVSFVAWSVHLCNVLMNKLIKRKQSIKSVCVWCQCMWTVKVIKSTNIIEHRSERTFQKERIAIQQTTQISIWKSKRHICESRV